MESQIREKLLEYARNSNLPDVEFGVEHPKDTKFGDYTTNFAMIYAKILKTNPYELAKQIEACLIGKLEHVKKIEVIKPGFINFFLDEQFFTENIKTVLERKDDWGKNDTQSKENILLEHTSPNLFKILHIGNLVGNIYGESMSRIFAYCGARVYKTTYPSDIGLTVAKAVWGVMKTDANVDNIVELGNAYKLGNDVYEEDAEAKTKIQEINKKIYDGKDEKINAVVHSGRQTSLSHVQEIMEMLGSSFDAMIFESEVGDIGMKTVNEATKNKILEESDGAIIFRGEKYGLHTRVFVNQMGLPTYETKDVGHFLLKQEKFLEWNRMIIVTSVEQKEYFKVLIQAIKVIFPALVKDKTLEHISTGHLTLSDGKMSSRKGNILASVDVIAQIKEAAKAKISDDFQGDKDALAQKVAIATLKYQILKQDVSLNITFDPQKALEFSGATGPYLQYTHARIMTLLKKSEEMNIVPSPQKNGQPTQDLEKMIYRFEGVVKSSCKDRSPHYITTYLTELASEFNTFYAQEKILDTKNDNTPYKLFILTAVAITIKNGLYLMGIEAPTKM